jgi:hypothetical protein
VSLSLLMMNVWQDVAVGATLLGALVAHGSLQDLQIHADSVRDDEYAAAGAAYAALVAANAPGLTALDLSYSTLHDDVLRPLVRALPHNTHLRSLNLYWTDFSEAFARDELLPAVRANASLRTLTVDDSCAGARAAAEVVKGRAAGR